MSTSDIKLSKSVRYSRTQMLLFSLLPKDGRRITSTELMNRMMARRKKMTDKSVIGHPRNLVITTMRHGLIKRVNANEAHFKICLTPQSGPYPIEYWIERKKKRSNGHDRSLSAARSSARLSTRGA